MQQQPRKKRVFKGIRREVPDRTYTFKLDPSNPDSLEGQAITALERKLQECDASGEPLKMRYIMACALLAIDGIELPDPLAQRLNLAELAGLFGGQVDELKELIESLREMGFQQVAQPKKRATKIDVPMDYIANLKKAIKRGNSE